MGAYNAVGASGTNASTTVKVGSLTGVSGSTLGGGTWIIGSDNRNAAFNGTISSGATFTKVGTGSWTLTGANLNTSAVTVNGGKLIAANTSGSATGTGNVTVNSSATLAGTGIIAGSVILNNGATLSPGITSIGTLTIGGSVAMQTGSKTIFKIVPTNYDKLVITGSVVLKGTLEIQPYAVTFAPGNSFKLFTASSAIGAFDAVSPATPGDGLMWNLSKITEGILSVDVSDAVNSTKVSNLNVYPSPVSDFCNIDLSVFAGKVRLELVDFSGKILQNESVDPAGKAYRLNMQHYHSGVYFIRIHSDEGDVTVTKLIKL
jgi:hypothetical protein